MPSADGDDTANTPEPSADVTTTPPEPPRIIRYTDDSEFGVQIDDPSDIEQLEGAPESFKRFILEQLGQTDQSVECDVPKSIDVEAIDTRGLAVGSVHECGGAIVVWGHDHNGWRELFGTQGPGTPCPADLAGFEPEDIYRIGEDWLCEGTPGVVTSGTFDLGETAHFRYFDVTVHEKRSASNGVEGGGIFGARVTVCYTREHPDDNADGSTRTSRDPWQFGWAHGPDPVWDRGSKQLSDHWTPVYRERRLKVGDCNSGWLTSDLRETAYVAHIGMRYAPASFDFTGTWTW